MTSDAIPDVSTVMQFRADPDGTIVLHRNGQPAPFFGQADVRGVRARKTRAAILKALDQAMQDGARHGPCDRQREMARDFNGEGRPAGCVRYETVPHPSCDGWAVARRDGDNDLKIILTGGRPYYSGGDVANALDRAFRVGGLFGHPAVDGIARPLPINGLTVTAVEIEPDRVLCHVLAHGYTVAHDLRGAQIIARVSGGVRTWDPLGAASDGYVVYRRYDGGRWKVATDEMSAAQLSAWDGTETQRPGVAATYPDRRITGWLDATIALKIA